MVLTEQYLAAVRRRQERGSRHQPRGYAGTVELLLRYGYRQVIQVTRHECSACGRRGWLRDTLFLSPKGRVVALDIDGRMRPFLEVVRNEPQPDPWDAFWEKRKR